MIDTLDSKNPNTCQKSRDASSRASSRVAKPRAPRPGTRRLPVGTQNARKSRVRLRGCPRAARDRTVHQFLSFDTRLVRDAVRQGAGSTHRTQQPAARGGSSSLSVAAAAPEEPRQPRAPRQPQDAGRGPRRGSPSVADGTGVAASTEPRQPAARLASAEHRQPRARAAVAATAAERRRRAVAATAAERRRAAVAAATRGTGRR